MRANARYQVAVLDPQNSGLRAAFEATMAREVRELGLDPDICLRFLDAREVAGRSIADPVVGIYRGGPRRDDACTNALELLCYAGADVLPLVDDLGTYPQSVPEPLLPINGMVLDPGDPQLRAPVGRVLEMLRLLRSRRRLFISYRRAESREVAVQLYDALQQKRFDVFLDTHGVQVGDRFQDELGQRLLDADVMIFLDTTGATASEWIRHEIEIANSLAIGVLQVVFPRAVASPGRLDRARFTELCEPLELSADDFEGTRFEREGGERLRPEPLAWIARAVEGLRARSMAARRNRLTAGLRAALDALPSPPPYNVEPGRHIVVDWIDGHRAVICPQIGVVDSSCLYQAETEAGAAGAVVLYDPTGLRSESERHLDWLCRHTRIERVSVLETEQWVARQ